MALEPLLLKKNQIPYFAPGDGRTDANSAGQEAQMECERQLKAAFAKQGIELVRMHPEMDPKYGHGFIQDWGQAIEIFSKIPKDGPVVGAFSQWAFNDRTAPILWEHIGAILDATNFHGLDPGLVGALSHRSCLAMHEYKEPQKGYSLLWSSDGFTDKEAENWIGEWLEHGTIDHNELLKYKKPFVPVDFKEYATAMEFGERLADNFLARPRLAGVYDIGCMGMLNAALDERDLKGTGVKLARLNQVELLNRMRQIPKDEAIGYINWLQERGFKLELGSKKETDITMQMIIDSGQMYGAHVKWAAELGLDTATIAFQTGMNSSSASSDLPEAMCNSTIRPPVYIDEKAYRQGRSFQLGNEADIGMLLSNLWHESAYEAASVDEVMSRFIGERAGESAYQALKDPKWWVTTGHDVRWGDIAKCKDWTATYTNGQKIKNLEAFIVALNLSGNMPVEHTQAAWTNKEKPWSDNEGKRHAYKYFPEGGICTKALARPGEMIWSRVYKIGDEKYLDIGRGAAVNLSEEETKRIWGSVTDIWPLNEAIFYGVSRDELMSGHMSNHISVSYAPNAETANIMMFSIGAFAKKLGFNVNICGDCKIENSVEYKVQHSLPVEGPYIRKAT